MVTAPKYDMALAPPEMKYSVDMRSNEDPRQLLLSALRDERYNTVTSLLF
jgi:hypothetical protein